jgi:hypothetical protein
MACPAAWATATIVRKGVAAHHLEILNVVCGYCLVHSLLIFR